jgi:hypothetical protein
MEQGEMVTHADMPDTDQPESVKDQASKMVRDVKGEVAHEIRHIHEAKEPVDPTQSDHVVRRHVAGLSITFFILIALFLLAAIAGIAIYTHAHH